MKYLLQLIESTQFHKVLWFLCLSATILSPSYLSAQLLEEVIVTAQKREQSLQDVGVAVTAFSENQIRNLGFTNTVDITAQTPSVQLLEWSPSYTVFNVRGVSQNDFADHLEPPVAVYVDDAYISAPGALNGLLFDMERVEVLRGPQGTLFGRNATGGLMHFVSNKPTENSSGYVQASFGERDLIEVEGAASGTLVKDKVLGRIAVKYQEQDGYLKTNIRDLAGKDGIAIKGQLQFNLNSDVEVLLNGRWTENDDLATGGYARDVATVGADGLGVFVSQGDPFNNTLSTRGFLDREIYGFGGKVTWDMGNDLELVSITDWFTMDKNYIEDTDGTAAPGFAFSTLQDFKQFTQELRLSGETDRMRWQTGVYYLDTKSDAGAGINGFADSGWSLFIGGIRGEWRDDVESYSFFGQVDFDLSEQFTLVTGLRYSNDDKKHSFHARHYSTGTYATGNPNATSIFDNATGPTLSVAESCDYFFAPGDPLVPVCIAAGGFYNPEVTYNPSTDADAKRTFDDISAKVQIEWTPNDDTLIYLGYNRGTKGGNWATPIFFPLDTSTFAHDGEVLNSYEIGTKLTFLDGRARLNASAFYYDYENYQGFTLLNLAQEITNLDAEVVGAEAELFLTPVEGLDLLVAIALLDSEVKGFTKPNGDVVNRELPQAPTFSLNFVARYEWPAFNGTLAAQVDGSYLDEQFLALDNSPVSLEPSYWDVNARVSYTGPGDKWTIAGWVKNFTDAEHRIYSLDVGGAGFVNSLYAPPLSAGVTVSYRWE
ncbi:MAG: TonB-dependent receptor [Gammaproteobacteria bacterium]|jgi:iron complex outermembrane recepter protein|nr:TonB-dependent receptor [Gammaproteobacteria bacterium]